MVQYVEPSSTFAQAQINWFNAIKDWIENQHIVVPVTVNNSIVTPITFLAGIFQSIRDTSPPMPQATAGPIIGSAISAYVVAAIASDFALVNTGLTFVFAPPVFPLDLTSSTKEGMLDQFSTWLCAGLLTVTSGGVGTPCTFQRI